MVRTYTWNPSMQSNLAVNGNFNTESEKTVSNPLPVSSKNLFSTQCFSNGSIYRSNYKNSQVTNISKTIPTDTAQNFTGTAINSSSEFLSASNNGNIQCQVHESQSQASSFLQPHHQSFPICYPLPFDFSTSSYRCRLPLYPSQITTPVVFEQTTNFNPVDLWHLRPIQIGSKVYYEPVSRNTALYSNPTTILPHTVTCPNPVVIPNNSWLQNGYLSHLPSVPIPVPTDNFNGQSKCLPSEACDGNQSVASSNKGSADHPWICGTSQPKNQFGEVPSWQTPPLATKENLIFDKRFNENSTVPTFQNPQRQTFSNKPLCNSSYQHSSSNKITPSLKHEVYGKVLNQNPAVDSMEQYKRDLQLQIEQNRRRKEEERQRELEIEKKEMMKFEEYRRKAQQEIEEEERREKEKILAAQRRAARMRALQEEAALKARREARNCARHNLGSNDEGTKTLEEKASSTTEANYLEWWERKKDYVNNAERPTHSPVIPTLRKKNEASADFSQNTSLVSNANGSNHVPTDRPHRSHSSQKLRRRSYHPSSSTSAPQNRSDSVRLC